MSSPLDPAQLSAMSAQLNEAAQRIIAGESTGDEVVDFVVRMRRQYDAATLARFRNLAAEVATHQDELVLISHCWYGMYVRAHGLTRHEYGYQLVHDLGIGQIAGTDLLFGSRTSSAPLPTTCLLPTSRFVRFRSTDIQEGFVPGEGPLDLHPQAAPNGWNTIQGWDWTLNPNQVITEPDSHDAGSFCAPKQPSWLTIVTGNDQVTSWLALEAASIRIEAMLWLNLQGGLEDMQLPEDHPVWRLFRTKPASPR